MNTKKIVSKALSLLIVATIVSVVIHLSEIKMAEFRQRAYTKEHPNDDTQHFSAPSLATTLGDNVVGFILCISMYEVIGWGFFKLMNKSSE
jgi:hypothetical protein